jgi:hypothetical protein
MGTIMPRLKFDYFSIFKKARWCNRHDCRIENPCQVNLITFFRRDEDFESPERAPASPLLFGGPAFMFPFHVTMHAVPFHVNTCSLYASFLSTNPTTRHCNNMFCFDVLFCHYSPTSSLYVSNVFPSQQPLCFIPQRLFSFCFAFIFTFQNVFR